MVFDERRKSVDKRLQMRQRPLQICRPAARNRNRRDPVMVEEQGQLVAVGADRRIDVPQVDDKALVHPHQCGRRITLQETFQVQVLVIRPVSSEDPAIVAVRLDRQHLVDGDEPVGATLGHRDPLHLHQAAEGVPGGAGLFGHVDKGDGPAGLGYRGVNGEPGQVVHDRPPQDVDDHGARLTRPGGDHLRHDPLHPLAALGGMVGEEPLPQLIRCRAENRAGKVVQADDPQVMGEEHEADIQIGGIHR